jgi:DprA winged helix domain
LVKVPDDGMQRNGVLTTSQAAVLLAMMHLRDRWLRTGQNGSHWFPASLRRLSELVNLDFRTVSDCRDRLLELKLVKRRPRREIGTRADRFQIHHIPSMRALANLATDGPGPSGAGPGSVDRNGTNTAWTDCLENVPAEQLLSVLGHPVWSTKALGKAPARFWQALGHEPRSVDELARAVGRSEKQAKRMLSRLEVEGLASRLGIGWCRGEATLDEVADRLGGFELAKLRRSRHIEERTRFLAWWSSYRDEQMKQELFPFEPGKDYVNADTGELVRAPMARSFARLRGRPSA